MVVLGHASLTFVDLDQDTWLVISVGGEDLRLLGWDGSVSADQDSHDTTSGFNTEGQWGNIQEEEILDVAVSFSSEDSSLDCSTVSDGFIGVDGSVQGLAIEEVSEHLLDLGDSGGTTDQHDFVDLTLSKAGVLQDVFTWWHALSEEVHAEFFELSSGDGDVEVFTFSEGLALNWSLMGR